MQPRLITSALALLCATTVANIAKASTPYTITGSGDKTIDDDTGDDWTEDTKWGEIGAYYRAGYKLYSNYSGSSMYEQVTGTVGAVLFDQDLAFGKMTLTATGGHTSTLGGQCKFDVFGITVVNASVNFPRVTTLTSSVTLAEIPLGVATVSGSGNFSYGLGEAGVSVDVTATVDADMSFVGVPLVFSAGASGEVGIEASASASYDGTTSTIDFTGKPYSAINLVGSAGVGTGEVSVGVSGSLTLVELGIPITNSLQLQNQAGSTTGYLSYATSGNLTLSSLGGEIDLYLHLLFYTYSVKLFDWDGVTWLNELLFTDSVPLASSPTTRVSGTSATLSYVYADANPESGSTIKWYRANNASGGGSGLIQNNGSKTYDLTEADSLKYLRACVTPSNGVNSGSQVCSGWAPVGPLLTYYKDSSYGGSALSVAYQGMRSGSCTNISSLGSSWNDKASSYKIQGVPGCTTVLHMYKDANCSGSEKTRTFPNGSGEGVSSMSSTLGSSWNDVLSSFEVVYCDEVHAEDVSVAFDGYKATGSYTLVTKSLFDDEASTYEWYVASDANGTGSTQFSTSSSFSLSPTYVDQYLKFCVTPDNGTTTGGRVCSSWTHVPAVVFYWDSSYGGSSLVFPYTQSASGTCYNINDVKSYWNDDVSSLKLIAPKTHSARIYVYKDTNCSGSTANTYAASGSTASVSSLGGTYGSGWNDELSSFKVVY